MKWTIHRVAAADCNIGQRLDLFIAEACAAVSRSLAKKIIDLGGVHLNGRRMRSCSFQVKKNDQVEVYLDHYPLEPFRISEADVVFRDQYLIVLNKPALIDTQPTHARYKGTLYEALQTYLKDPFRPHHTPDLGMVQRLDRGTSGLIAFSIHPRAHKNMTEIFVQHRIEKRYLTLVQGTPTPPQGEIRSSLARSRKQNKVKSVEKGGKDAITRYQLLEDLQDAALLDIDLLTGRSHQIRAHLSEQGHPLLGDQLYGGPVQISGITLDRALLHASRLLFAHPVTGDPLEFTVPMPADMCAALAALKK